MASFITLLAFSFWVWMFYECFRNERENIRLIWALMFIGFSFLGAAIYFLVRWVPRTLSLDNPFAKFAQRSKLQDGLRCAIADVRNIGNAHQYVKLGHIHQQMGNCDHALAAYQQALVKDPDDIEALWGSSAIELKNKNLRQGSMLLQRLMTIRPDFKFGDASAAYGQVLFDMGDFNLAQQHLQRHLQQWQHPEAILLMAQIQIHQRNMPKAREVLEKMIIDVEGAPAFHYRKHRQHVAQARRLLKTLKCSVS